MGVGAALTDAGCGVWDVGVNVDDWLMNRGYDGTAVTWGSGRLHGSRAKQIESRDSDGARPPYPTLKRGLGRHHAEANSRHERPATLHPPRLDYARPASNDRRRHQTPPRGLPPQVGSP